MSVEARIEQLEADVFKLRKILHKKNDNQHMVWNDLQDQIREKLDEHHRLLQSLSVDTAELKAKLEQQRSYLITLDFDIKEMKAKQDGFEKRLERLESGMTDVKSDITSLKEMVQTLLDRP